MPYGDVPGFLTKLQGSDTTGETVRLAFEFLILTAVRSGEMRGARWEEIDLEARLWTIPGQRMKAGKTHVVPLSARAVTILDRMRELRRGENQELVFEGAKLGRLMSDMTLTRVLRRMEENATAHGFRSSFRDWAAEATNFPREVAEAALAHAVESRVEAAYRRSDLLEKRRKLMEQWDQHCAGRAGAVVPLARKKTAS
jgi:integrase